MDLLGSEVCSRVKVRVDSEQPMARTLNFCNLGLLMHYSLRLEFDETREILIFMVLKATFLVFSV